MGTALPPDEVTAAAELAVTTNHIWDHWASARDYSEALFQAASSMLGDTTGSLQEITPPTYEVQLAQSGITGALPTAPQIDQVGVAAVDFTGEVPTFDEPTISSQPVPEPTYTEPNFAIPDAPDVEFPILTQTAPAVSDVQLPTAPGYELPPIPSIREVVIPKAPEFNLPTFEGTYPTMDLTPPSNAFDYAEEIFTHQVLTQLQDKLQTDLTNGGSGLDPATEQAIYDRAISRQETENEKLINDTLNFFAGRGFPLPPGALAGALLEASARITQVREDLNNDILIQQSKLAQENTHFIVSQSAEHMRDLMGHFDQVKNRSLDAAKTVMMMAIEIYKARIEGYKGQLQAYQVMAQVYEARIRAEVAKAEMYRAQVDGAKAQVEVQMLYVDAYKAQIEGIRTLIQMYATQMEAARIQADIDKTRIDGYRAIVEAYKYRVEAVTARYDAYAAQIRGEEAKAAMYKAQVDGYVARVGAYKAQADVDVARAQVAVETLRGRSQVFGNEVERFKALVDATIQQAETNIKGQALDVDVYRADIQRYNAEMEARVGEMNAIVREIAASLDLEAKVFEAIQRYNQAVIETNAESGRIGAKVAGQQAAAYISTHTTSVTAGHRENRSDSRGASASNSAASNTSASAHVGTYTHITKSG